MSAKNIQAALRKMASPQRAKTSARFFKTGPGDYAEGDQFLGVAVPDVRKVTRQFFDSMAEGDFKKLLGSPFHEDRQAGTIALVRAYETCKEITNREKIFRLYQTLTYGINNWDLVDLSAHKIVGALMLEQNSQRGSAFLWAKSILKSSVIWERRIAIVATQALIKEGQIELTLAWAKVLLADPHELMHKATGWMLREAGKIDLGALESFLDKHTLAMPRTMLRYAIEKLPEAKRKSYLQRR